MQFEIFVGKFEKLTNNLYKIFKIQVWKTIQGVIQQVKWKVRKSSRRSTYFAIGPVIQRDFRLVGQFLHDPKMRPKEQTHKSLQFCSCCVQFPRCSRWLQVELVNDLPILHGTTQPNSLFKALSNTDDRAILKKQLRTKNRQLFSLWQRTYGCFSSSRDLARPLNQTVMGLYRWEPLIASNHPAKSGGLLQVLLIVHFYL